MLEAIDESSRTLVNVFNVAVRKIGFKHRDDLVVSLFAVDHSEAADGVGLQKKVALGKSLLSQHADVHRVAVAFDVTGVRAFGAKLRHFISTKRLRDQPI